MVLEKASRKSDAESAAERKANIQPGGVTSIRNALVLGLKNHVLF